MVQKEISEMARAEV